MCGGCEVGVKRVSQVLSVCVLGCSQQKWTLVNKQRDFSAGKRRGKRRGKQGKGWGACTCSVTCIISFSFPANLVIKCHYSHFTDVETEAQ